jgi:hypothetical protein
MRKNILFVGHCYYYPWHLSRELRKLGWKADVLNIDLNPASQMYYHGEDFSVKQSSMLGIMFNLWFFVRAIFKYDFFHFANAESLYFPPFRQLRGFHRLFGVGAEIKLLRKLGKKIFYTNNGCRDGVTQTSFNKWEPYRVCDICPWQNNPNVCSDEKNSRWGQLRNSLTDYIGTHGGNRVDFNDSPIVHEAPWIYCLDKKLWDPETLIPSNYLLPFRKETIKVFHAVGNYDSRSHGKNKQTIKSTEIWFAIVERLKNEGYDVEIIFFKDVPNKQLRYYQLQADIFVDMLTYGFFGANVREAMMLGKPAICYLRPEWLASMRAEIPDYVDELPVVSATPETAYEVLRDLIICSDKRKSIGRGMREFGLKWHASDAAAQEADRIYSGFLK